MDLYGGNPNENVCDTNENAELINKDENNKSGEMEDWRLSFELQLWAEVKEIQSERQKK